MLCGSGGGAWCVTRGGGRSWGIARIALRFLCRSKVRGRRGKEGNGRVPDYKRWIQVR